MNKSLSINIAVLLVALALLIGVDLFFGSVTLSLKDISEGNNTIIFYDIRLPKALTSLLAGGGLAVAGVLMQTLFRNPLAGPYVLGISSGASLMVAVSLMLFGGITHYFAGKALISVSAITGSMLVMALVLFISKRSRSNITVLLVGIMFSQILGALQGILEYISNPASLKSFVVWGMGSVSNTSLSDLQILLPIVVFAFFAALVLSKSLNAILLNESYAQNLGVNVNRLRITVIIITAVITGVITAFCGPIAFVGLSVPIASRILFKTSHQLHQLIYSFLLGAITLVLCDCICQMLSDNYVLPINAVTTLIGSPVVIYLLFKSKTIA